MISCASSKEQLNSKIMEPQDSICRQEHGQRKCRANFRPVSIKASALKLTVQLAALLLTTSSLVSSWRVLDYPTTLEARQAYGSLLQPAMPSIFGPSSGIANNNNNNNNNFLNANHLLIPSTLSAHHQVVHHSPSSSYQPVASASHYANVELAPQSAGLQAPGPQYTSNNQRVPTDSLSAHDAHTQADESHKVSAPGGADHQSVSVPALELAKSIASAMISSRSVDSPLNASINPLANEQQQQQQQQQQPASGLKSHNSSSIVAANPSPAGKILNSALQVAVSAINSSIASSLASSDNSPTTTTTTTTGPTTTITTTTNSSSIGEKLQNVAVQILKPRKHSDGNLNGAGKVTANNIEQQIINQHARLHPGSHQRLLPTKHRDNKLVGSLVGESSSLSTLASFKDSSSIYNLLFGGQNGAATNEPSTSLSDWKSSGISSRSSIVKAISDNKLARTISSLSKSIGGNKYVASAAAASALAALGLTVSKLLSPYLFAGTYSKLSDPMMSSGSFLNPSYMNTDRNYFYSSPSEPLLGSPSTPSSNMRVSQAGGYYAGFGSMSPTPTSSGQQLYSPITFDITPMAGYQDQPSAADYQQAYANYLAQASLLRPTTASSSSPMGKHQSGVAANGETGHYSDFYAQHGATSAAEPELATTASMMNGQQYTGGTYLFTPASGLASDPNGGSIPTGYYRYTPQRDQFVVGDQQIVSEQQQQQQQSHSHQSNANSPTYDQIMTSSSSLDNQVISQQQAPQFSQANRVPQRQAGYSLANSGRRSGAVSLKMDETTRAKLHQQLEEKYSIKAKQVGYIMTPPQLNLSPSGDGQSSFKLSLAGERATENPIAPMTSDNVFVPISSLDSSTNDHRLHYYYPTTQRAQAMKSSRSETSTVTRGASGSTLANGNDHAPMSRQQQGQVSQPAYLWVRPNSHQAHDSPNGNQVNEAGASANRGPELGANGRENNVGRISVESQQATGAAWKSLESTSPAASVNSQLKSQPRQESQWTHMVDPQQQRPAKQTTSTPPTTPLAINNNNNNNNKQRSPVEADADQSHQAQQVSSMSGSAGQSAQDDQQSASGSQSAQDESTLSNGATDHILHRVSRTPPISQSQSVKGLAVAATSIDSLTDYDSDTLNGGASGIPSIAATRQQQSVNQQVTSSQRLRPSNQEFVGGPQLAFVESSNDNGDNGDAGNFKFTPVASLTSMSSSSSSSSLNGDNSKTNSNENNSNGNSNNNFVHLEHYNRADEIQAASDATSSTTRQADDSSQSSLDESKNSAIKFIEANSAGGNTKSSGPLLTIDPNKLTILRSPIHQQQLTPSDHHLGVGSQPTVLVLAKGRHGSARHSGTGQAETASIGRQITSGTAQAAAIAETTRQQQQKSTGEVSVDGSGSDSAKSTQQQNDVENFSTFSSSSVPRAYNGLSAGTIA